MHHALVTFSFTSVEHLLAQTRDSTAANPRVVAPKNSEDLGWCVDDDVDDDYDDDSCLNCGPLDLDKASNGTKCESTSCGVSICNTDAAPARRISVAAAVAALVSVLIA